MDFFNLTKIITMNKSDKILEKIFAKTTKGIKLGLDRMQNAARDLGDPQEKFLTVHVAGTNGKGSVCHYIESGFRSSNFKTGLYTSPHLVKFSERFCINGVEVSDDEWLDVYYYIEPIADRYELTFFEISTLIAFELFRKNGVDIAVIETGLGGRLDATNIISPKVSVITNIGIDHTDFLGSSIEKIATEKFGIIKRDIPTVLMKPSSNSVESLAVKICSEKNSNLNIIDLNMGKSEKFIYKGLDFKLSLKGNHQKNNALCALKALELCGITINEKIRDAICKVQIVGRYYRTRYKGIDFIFDVAHNPQAVNALITQLKSEDKSCIIIAGLMADKDTNTVVKSYSLASHTLIFTRPNTVRAEKAENLASMVPDDFNGSLFVESAVKNAIELGLNIAKKSGDQILVTGSFYTVGNVIGVMT